MKRTFENPQIGDVIHFAKYAREAGSPDTVIDIDLQPGGGNALHRHRTFDEHFECLQGELRVQVGHTLHILHPGQRATAPRGVLHRFFSTSELPTRFRITISPGHEGFEKMLQITYGLATEGLVDRRNAPKKFWHLGVVALLSDTELPGLIGLLRPLLLRVGRRALADGRYERELRQYTH